MFFLLYILSIRSHALRRSLLARSGAAILPICVRLTSRPVPHNRLFAFFLLLFDLVVNPTQAVSSKDLHFF